MAIWLEETKLYIAEWVQLQRILSHYVDHFLDNNNVKMMKKVIRKYSQREYRLRDFPLDKKELRGLVEHTLQQALYQSIVNVFKQAVFIVSILVICRELLRFIQFPKNKMDILNYTIFSLRVIKFIIILDSMLSWSGYIPGLEGMSSISFLRFLTAPIYNIPFFRELPLNILPIFYLRGLNWMESYMETKLSQIESILEETLLGSHYSD